MTCAALVIFAGSKLSRYGDEIGKVTGLGGFWVGVMLLAISTSLPEVFTAIGCVLLAIPPGGPNLAVGNVLGSNLFNLMIIVLLDLFYQKKTPYLLEVSPRHVLSSSLGLLLCSIACFSIILNSIRGKTFALFGVGLDSILILFTYLFGAWLIFCMEKSESGGIAAPEESSPTLYLKFGLCVIVVIGASLWLGHLGDVIAKSTGLSHTFVGSIFLAITTSLPEVVVSLSALRLGNHGMALGNVLGSNMINMTIIPIADLFFGGSPILSVVLPSHALTALLVIILTSILIIGLLSRSKRMIFGLGWTTASMFVIYLLGNLLLF